MQTVRSISTSLIPFTTAMEGRVHKAYRDSGGVWTIGIGFTMLDATFKAYWLKTRGHALRAGDTITDAECDTLLPAILNAEYLPAVLKRFDPVPYQLAQKEIDTATDVTFNCGAGSLKWNWAAELAAGHVATAAALLKKTALTAGGKFVAGLVNRRDAQARLMLNGDYGRGVAPSSTAAVAAYQEDLKTLGFYRGAVSGFPDVATQMAVRDYQRKAGLVVDGVVGPATRATIKRDIGALNTVRVTGSATVAGGGGGATVEVATQQHAFDWGVIVTYGKWALVVGGIAFAVALVWRYRGVILRRKTPA